jgi:hypothetical protein
LSGFYQIRELYQPSWGLFSKGLDRAIIPDGKEYGSQEE